VRAAVSGARIVTARGWEDLSRMLLAYEREGIEVNLPLVSQYLQDSETAEDFSLYYDLFAKYQDDYKVGEILAGTAGNAIERRARIAPFDERIALVNLLLDAITDEIHDTDATEQALRGVRTILAAKRDELASFDGASVMEGLAASARTAFQESLAKGSASAAAQREAAERSELMERLRAAVAQWATQGSATQGEMRSAFEAARVPFNDAARGLAARVGEASAHLDAALTFLDRCFGDGQELLVFASHLAVDPVFMRFVSAHGSDSFVQHSQALMFHERGLDLLREVDELEDL